MKCNICPRKCNVDRLKSIGFCGEKGIRIAKIIENFAWEEPCISGKKGALAIFFSGCNLRCRFCQNYEISHIGKGKEYSPQEFRSLLESYDLSKFDSIDLVTPTHFVEDLCLALHGFKSPIPIVFNSSGYEGENLVKKASLFADVFLVDFKFYQPEISFKLAGAKDYFQVASKAVKLMSKLKPNKFENGILQQGVLIRHLILPGYIKDSFKILDFIKAEIKDPFISIMSQFTPIEGGIPNRKLLPLEVKAVLAHADKIGLKNGYYQDLDSANSQFIPNF